MAPYWVNIDIRGTGDVYYRQTTNRTLLVQVASDLQSSFPEYQNLTITNLLIVTWDSVGYYDMNTDKVSYI